MLYIANEELALSGQVSIRLEFHHVPVLVSVYSPLLISVGVNSVPLYVSAKHPYRIHDIGCALLTSIVSGHELLQ